MPSMDSIFRELNIGYFILYKNNFQPRKWTLGASLISGHTCFPVGKHHFLLKQLVGLILYCKLVLEISFWWPCPKQYTFQTDIRKIPLFWGSRWEILRLINKSRLQSREEIASVSFSATLPQLSPLNIKITKGSTEQTVRRVISVSHYKVHFQVFRLNKTTAPELSDLSAEGEAPVSAMQSRALTPGW